MNAKQTPGDSPIANDAHEANAEMPAPWSSTLWWLSLGGIIVALDQYSKKIVTDNLPYRAEVEVLPFFSWVHWQNAGAAFSFLDDAGGWQRWAFVVLALGFSAFLLFELRRLRRGDWVQALAFALILGGALGNMIDRALLGYVIDFLKFHWGTGYFPAFNLADSAIFLGAALWFTQIWREMRQDGE